MAPITESVTNRPLDTILIFAYLLITILLGRYFSKKSKSTDDYFLGGRSLPGWALGISLLASSISSISFFAMPAAAFILDYRNFTPRLTLPLIGLIAAWKFIPVFRNVNISSAFEYVEHRYCPAVRVYTSISYLILQFFRMGTILYLLSIPLSIVTGQNILLIIVVVGLIIGSYTISGGFRTIIWMNVVQAIVILGGCLFCLGFIIYSTPGGPVQILAIASEHHKFGLGDLSLSFNERTLGLMLIFGFINYLEEYAGNQAIIQRYIAAKSLRDARKAAIISSITMLPVWFLFFLLGTCLFVYYQVTPDPSVKTMEADKVLSHFILTRIPAGVSSIVIASCIAAAISSMDSAINAVSSVLLFDVVKRFMCKHRNDAFYLKTGRILSVLTISGTVLAALLIKAAPKDCIIDLGFIVSSLIGGGTLSIYLFGFFSKIDNTTVLSSIAVAVCANTIMICHFSGLLPESLTFPLHSYTTIIIVNASFALTAMVLGFFRSKRLSTVSKQMPV